MGIRQTFFLIVGVVFMLIVLLIWGVYLKQLKDENMDLLESKNTGSDMTQVETDSEVGVEAKRKSFLDTMSSGVRRLGSAAKDAVKRAKSKEENIVKLEE